jgi:RimJ/RimL family protein N-acetyltransferase
MATLGGVRSVEETERYLQVNLAHWQRHGFGLWIIRDHDTGEHLGHGGLRHVTIAGREEEVEITYALRPRFWGRGLATNLARALVTVAHGQLAIPEIVGFTLTTNMTSRRVLEKTGFEYQGPIDHGQHAHVLYRHTTQP